VTDPKPLPASTASEPEPQDGPPVPEELDSELPTVGEVAPTTPPQLPVPELRDYTLVRENVRGNIAKSLVLLLWATVVASFVTLWISYSGYDKNTQLKELLTIVFAPIVALVGAATGYYFGGASGGGGGRSQT
jgi:hypothetical protein